MKLSDWAKKEGIKYLTAYRWFKADKMPVPCYQTDSGTIIVDIPEKNMQDDQLKNQAVSQFLKKTVEFSKQNTSIEDFAAYVLSNYKLETTGSESEVQKSVRNKPTKEMISQHFNQFLKKNDKRPEPNMFLMNEKALDTITEASAQANSSEEALAQELSSVFDPQGSVVGTVLPVNTNYKSLARSNQVRLMANDLSAAFGKAKGASTVKTLQSIESGSVISRSFSPDPIDVSTTDQSTSSVFFNSGACAASFPASILSNSSYTPELNLNYDETESSFIKNASEFSLCEEEKVSYEEARLLVDAMVRLNQVDNDSIKIDRKAKEICTWAKDTFNSIYQITMMAARKEKK